jgi:ABC-type dipeptide/oligopeptide/nickel transport system permease subunit
MKNEENEEIRKQAGLLLKIIGVMLVLPAFLLTLALALIVPAGNDGKYANGFVSLILFVVLLALFQDNIVQFISNFFANLFRKKS